MQRLSATTVWLVGQGAFAFAQSLVFTVSAVYFVREVGMNPLQLVLVGTALELAYFLFEVPTGIVADVYSRRLSVIVGMFVVGVSFLLIGATAEFAFVAAAYVVMGFGWTFISGALEAWLADEIGPENVGPANQNAAQVGRVVSLVGIGTSVGLALVDLRLPIALGGVVTLATAVFLVLTMPETGFVGSSEGDERGFRAMAQTARTGGHLVRRRPILLLILGISAFWGLWSEGFDRLGAAHFLLDVGLPRLAGLDPVVWFGIFNAGALVLSIAVAAPLRRRLGHASRETMPRVLFALNAWLIASVVAFGLAVSLPLALAAVWATTVARSVAMPLYSTWLNQSIDDSRVRATVISITNQADAVGQWAGGPAIGAVGTLFSIRAALVVGGLTLSPALGLYARAIRHEGGEPAVAPLPQPVEP